jgi:hypothetical protein
MAPLYHYTDRGGLNGIITTQKMRFTHYRHLNDDAEISFGIAAAQAVLAEFAVRHPKAKIFCELTADLLTAENLDSAFGFYVASFSRKRDHLHQWKHYAGGGQGFAIGFGPQLFGIEDKPNRQPHENVFVSPVRYGDEAARLQHRPAVESAVRIVLDTAEHKAKAMSDANRGMPFFREMAEELLASELILNCLIAKACKWAPEHEVRQFILGQTAMLAPCVSTRYRDGKAVPYINGDMPLRRPGGIAEILIGPAAPPDAEDFTCSLLAPFHSDPRSIIHRSTIHPSELDKV